VSGGAGELHNDSVHGTISEMPDQAWWKLRLAVLDVTSAAAELGVSREYVRRLVRDGRVRGVRVGASWAIEAASWEDFKRRPRVPGRPPKNSSQGGGRRRYPTNR
jgi:excisionase family DNA binding protein